MPGKNRQTRGRLPWPAVLLLLGAWPLLGGWSLWRDDAETAEPVEMKDACLRLAIKIDDLDTGNAETVWADHAILGKAMMDKIEAEYHALCEKRPLHGCLLPPEKVTKIEEYQYRKRHCQARSEDCKELKGRVGRLQHELLALRENKNKQCLAAKGDYDDSMKLLAFSNACEYAVLQIAAVFDAIALNETYYEKACLDR